MWSAKTLHGDARRECSERSKIVLVAGDEQVAAERCRRDHGRVDGIGPSRAREELTRLLG